MADAYPESLERAILAGVPLQVRVDLGGILVPATARLCPRGIQPGPPKIWVKAPSLSDDRPFPAPPGSPLAVSFLLNGQRFAFETEISSVRPLPGERRSDVWILPIPRSLSPQQRRAAYRLHRWTSPLPKARIWPIGPGPASSTLFPEGTIENLSATGMGLLVVREAARAFLLGRTLGLNFRLGPARPPIVLRGVVRSRRSRPRTDLVNLGIAFLEAVRGPDHLRSINQLTHYVAEQERLQIRKTREIE